MTLAEIRDWLKTQVTCPQWYIGKMDGKKPECIGVYPLAGRAPVIAVGGLSNTSYATKGISILVHWGRNADSAEAKAQEVYDALFGVSGVTIGGRRVVLSDLRFDAPIGVGTDNEGTYEYVIETIIYYVR
jgi:hypothetical protein